MSDDFIVDGVDGPWTFPAVVSILPAEARSMPHGHMIGAPRMVYRRADLPPTLAQFMALPEVATLLEAARRASHATTNDGITGPIYTREAIALRRALAALKGGAA